jgi:hypothetical protein
MGYGNRAKPERKSGRAGFVDARLEELPRRWENATDEREKNEVSEQIRELSLLKTSCDASRAVKKTTEAHYGWTRAKMSTAA